MKLSAHFSILLLVATPLLADGFTDLKAALIRMQDRDPMRSEVDLQLWRRKADGGPSLLTQGEGRAWIEDGPGGTSLRFPAQMLEQVQREGLEKMKQPDAPTPITDCMDELGARHLVEYLAYGPVLLRNLEQCHLLGEEASTMNGKPARMLRFSVDPSLPASIKKLLDRIESDVRIWIEPDGTPVAADIRYTFKGSRFFISFSGAHHEHLDFLARQQRLLVTRHDWEESYQGFGQKTESHKLYKLREN